MQIQVIAPMMLLFRIEHDANIIIKLWIRWFKRKTAYTTAPTAEQQKNKANKMKNREAKWTKEKLESSARPNPERKTSQILIAFRL